MLKSIRMQNFKSYKDATFELSPFTVLIGANASGKSNAIEALRFMSLLAQGNKLYKFNSMKDEIRGNINSLMYQGEEKCLFACEFSDIDYSSLDMELSLRDEELHISKEILKSAKKNLYYIKSAAHGNSSDVVVAYNNFTKGSKKPSIPLSDQTPIYTQLTSPAPILEKYKISKKVISDNCLKVETNLKSFFFLDPVPVKMRNYCPKDRILLGNGENLSGVLCDLTENTKRFSESELNANKKEILAFIESLPEQNFKDLRSIKTESGHCIVSLKESFGKKDAEYNASLLSDGTLRVLAIAVALLSVPENTTVVIEELDNGIHPSRAKTLLSRINDVATRRNLKILVTTHNPALLNALPDDVVPNCVYCYRDAADGSSKLVKLSNLPNYISLIERDSLGNLLTSLQLENAVKNVVSKEEKKKRSLEWLNRMMGETK